MPSAAMAPVSAARSAVPARAAWALRIATGLLFLSGYMALASVREYGTALLGAAVLVLALSPLGERLDRGSTAYRLVTRAISVAYFCFIPLSVFLLSLLPAVIALVVFIQFYTVLHQKEEKSYYHLFLMSFFLLLAACSQAPEASIGPVLLLFLLSTIWSFFALRVAYEAEASRTQVPPDIVRFDEEPLRQAHDHRDPFDLGVVAYVFTMVLCATGLTVAIFFLTPRVEAGLLGRSNAPLSTTGTQETVRLQSGTTILEDFTPILRAEFPDEPGGRTAVYPLYWRLTTLAKFDGMGWQRAGLIESGQPGVETARRMHWQPDSYEVKRRRIGEGRLVRQVVYMDEVPLKGVPALDLVQQVAVTGRPRGTRIDWDDAQDFTLLLHRDGARQLHYEAWSEVDEPTPEQLRAASGAYDLEEEDFALLTEHQLLPETVALTRQITAGAPTNYDKAAALRDYLSGPNYLYSLTLPPLPRDHAIDHFINETRVGHCELFGTAMALMLRSLGIPARVVSGFKGGEFDENDQGYVIRNSMAHLWVEVLFPEYGWVKFDPSPVAESAGATGLLARMQLAASLYALKARMIWFRDVVGYQGSRTLDLQDLQFRLFSSLREFQGRAVNVVAPERLGQGITIAFLLGGVAVALLWFVYRWLVDNARRRRSPLGHYTLTRDQIRAVRMYRALRTRLRRAGVDTAGKTAEELMEAIERSGWVDSAEAEALLTAYNEARFGGRGLERSRLGELLRALRDLKLRPAAP